MKRKKFKTKSKSKKNSKQLREYIKRKREETGIYERRHFIKMTCNICKNENKIRINNKSIYTEEIIKNYICLLCKDTWKYRLWKKGLIKIDENGKIKVL